MFLYVDPKTKLLEGPQIVLLCGNVVQSTRTPIDLSITEYHKAILKLN